MSNRITRNACALINFLCIRRTYRLHGEAIGDLNTRHNAKNL
jgi:hypothetical protein